MVARARLAPGKVIEAADVALVSIRLPAEIEATVFGEGDGSDVVGSVVLEAVHAGELLTRGDIGSRRSTAGRDAGYAVAVELDRPAALNGLIAAGERVDVAVTDRNLADGADPDTPGLVLWPQTFARVVHAAWAVGAGRPHLRPFSARMRARSRRCAASTSGSRALVLRQRR